VRSFRSLHQLLTLSLWRCRSRRACVRACVYPHACVCGRVCIHMRRRAYVHVHAYARAPVYRGVHAHAYACACMCARMRGWRFLMAAPRRVGWCLGRAYAPMCMCMHVHAYMHGRMCTACSECCMHFGTGVLGTSAWASVYVTQVCFYTNVHICDTLTAGCAHMCVCVYVCIWMRVCMDACMRL